ncbi:MAG TPA: FAD-dependent oxidoreductase [Solirubrobacteraceae bacterium]|nr:FAD-dependent oxidoreductase [Solirubrobacteraceae bacterium]
MDNVDVLIVGAGAAGSACAETLHAGGFDGSILLAGRDVDPPYERPFCSKQYLCGDVTREQTYLGLPDELDLRVRTSVMKLDTEARTAKLPGAEVSFRHAVLATGANVRRLRVDGAELEGIHYLRALGNADAIRDEAANAERIVLVGGSYIACEVAASLTSQGRSCTLVMQEDMPLSLGFGRTAGEFFAGVLRDHGIDWVANDALGRFEGDGRVQRVVTESGRVLDADLVVMGTGAMPDVMLARSSGLELGETGGIACSSRLETSVEGVWAAGDACEYESVVHGRRLRVEHWEHARAQGAHVAQVILGSDEPFSEIPYFWSDLADWCTLEYVGPASEWDREVVVGSPADGEFSIFYLFDGRVAAALTVGRSDDLDRARELMASGEKVDADSL